MYKMATPLLETVNTALHVLNLQKARFVPEATSTWPKLPVDWEAVCRSGDTRRMEELSSQCAQARAVLQSQLLRPEVVTLVMHLQLESPYMTCIWALLRCSVPLSMATRASSTKMREGIILSTVHSVPNAFYSFYSAIIPKLVADQQKEEA